MTLIPDSFRHCCCSNRWIVAEKANKSNSSAKKSIDVARLTGAKSTSLLSNKAHQDKMPFAVS